MTIFYIVLGILFFIMIKLSLVYIPNNRVGIRGSTADRGEAVPRMKCIRLVPG